MEKKIKEALRQEYKGRLELDEEQLDGVAAFVATFVSNEAKIEEAVKNGATFTMLKSYQRMLDRDRAKRKTESEQGQRNSDTGNQSESQQGFDVNALLERFNAAIEAKLNPLQEKLTAFETAQIAKDVYTTAETSFKGNAYVKMYSDEASDAWDRAKEMYEATGKKWTADEFSSKAMGYFNKAVGKRGVDTTRPITEGNTGGASQADKDKAFRDEIRAALGLNDEKD